MYTEQVFGQTGKREKCKEQNLSSEGCAHSRDVHIATLDVQIVAPFI